tara:strand:+ start:138 stop:371 length:234 start_codon:yes stop_codon:yes gene_type:complete
LKPIETYKLNSKLETETNKEYKIKEDSMDASLTLASNQQEQYYRHLNDKIKTNKIRNETLLIWFSGYVLGFLLGFII